MPLNPDFVQCDKPRAEALASEVERESEALEVSWFRLGKALVAARDEHAPMALGVTWEQFVEKHCRCSYSKATRALAAYQAAKELPESKVLALGEGKAKQLARPAVRQLPEKKREELLEIAVREDVSLGAFQAVVRKELGITEEAWISWRVPLAVEKQLEAAVKKIARIFSIDLAEEPNRRVLCLEYIAGLVDGLPEDTLRVAITGE